MPGGDEEPGIDELARPQMKLFIGEGSFEANSASSGVDLIIDDSECAFVEQGAIVAIDCEDSEFMAGVQLLLNLPQILLGQGEIDGDRTELCDDDEAVGIAGGVNDVALIDEADARATIEGGDDFCIRKLDPGAVNGGLIGLDGGCELIDGRFLGIVILL